MLNKLRYIIDIGSSSLRMFAIIKRGKKSRLVAEEAVLYDGYLDGEFLSVDDLDNKLLTLVENMQSKLRKKITSVVIGVPSDFCVCVCKRISRKFITPHKITNSDIVNLYESNLNVGNTEEYSVINYSPMQFVLDGNLKTLNAVGKKVSSLILDASYILAKKDFLQLITNKLETIGIKTIEFVSTALGQGMACEPKSKNNKPIAIVDCGHITTSVSIFKGEGLALMSSFSLGGGHISSDLMQVLGLSFKDSELIKRKVILTIESNKNDYYEITTRGNVIKAPINITNQVVKSRIEKIAKIIGEILTLDDVYNDVDIYLTGDGLTHFKGVKNIIKNTTNRQVYEYKIPFDNSYNKYQTSKTGLISLVDILN